METPRDNNIALLASTFVLFSAMLDARITIVLSLTMLLVLLAYKLLELRAQQPDTEKKQ